ncbi:hypothetical protein SDRG_09356 [Saprolegnia diclina VS20]|uniref:Beta-lactamase-related domain-containing protein n=1 Tax=Saprolegnia diclina (strain VS20) TaxID=1156394 RepID=T0RKG3_SAPDV|nr:hypothetical protein SDRG_09356 [Saprolegnia diclina VS20]EQC32818.1 hypothetical protein SDRG_09356 [Saprolegnia diclina VS20]|eukprot:XP_008613504.1 hypothetical protein SDRG_09356 [Saprolegnia diclina VS20]
MKLWIPSLLCFLLALAVAQESLDDVADERYYDAATTQAIAFIKKKMKAHSITGMGVAVVRNNKTVLATGFGLKRANVSSDVVRSTTGFEIGSVSKTHIAIALAKLVDDGKLQFADTVKSRLPWFTLQDKYAEAHTTIGDLLAHNSVLTDDGDVPMFFGRWASERDNVENLAFLQTYREFRAGYSYANLGYQVLGQVIEAVSGLSWHEYLQHTIWTPLGMKSTYAHAGLAPPGQLSFGHYVCNKTVIGPYPLFTSSLTILNPSSPFVAAGSIVSTPADMAIFTRFVLQHGAGIFKSPALVKNLATGYASLPPTRAAGMTAYGFEYDPEGNAYGVGYGYDMTGALLFGHRYFTKSGATMAHFTETGYAPGANLAVTLLSNTAVSGGPSHDHAVLTLMQVYILGIYLGVPRSKLDATWDTAFALADKLYPAQPCDSHFFGKEPWPSADLPVPGASTLAGTYAFASSPTYSGPITVHATQDKLSMRYYSYDAPLLPLGNNTFVWAIDFMASTFVVPFTTQPDGSVALEFFGSVAVKG